MREELALILLVIGCIKWSLVGIFELNYAELIIDSVRIHVFPCKYKFTMCQYELFRHYEYAYDKYYGFILCPENHF